jgi:predicted ester cyclase
MAVPRIGDTFRAWVEAINGRNWPKAAEHVAPTVVFGGQQLSREQFVASIRDSIEAFCPDARLEVDMTITSAAGDRLAVRVIHAATFAKETMGVPATGKRVEYAENSMVWGDESGLVARVQSLTDWDAARQGVTHVERTPEDLPRRPPALAGDGERQDLDAQYRAYIDIINARTMPRDLPRHVHPRLQHNHRDLTLPEYCRLIESSFEEIDGLTFTIVDLVVDEASQRVASRLEFTGTPLKPFRGIQPTGRSVKFWEHAYYQLDEGKISYVASILDFEAYKKCLEG